MTNIPPAPQISAADLDRWEHDLRDAANRGCSSLYPAHTDMSVMRIVDALALLAIAHRVAEAEARGRREALTEFQDWFLDGALETVCGGESMMHASHSFDDECKKLREMLARAAGGGT